MIFSVFSLLFLNIIVGMFIKNLYTTQYELLKTGLRNQVSQVRILPGVLECICRFFLFNLNK